MNLEKIHLAFYNLGFLLLLGLSTSFVLAPEHEFHLSKCQIDYNAEEKALQMSLHLFIDDLEEALRQGGVDQLFLCTEKEAPQADQHLLDYLETKFQLDVNQQSAVYQFVGKEPSEDLQGVWVYLEITNVESLSELTVTNQLLLEVFADQKNLISIFVPPGHQNYFIMERGKSQESLKF